MLEPGVFFKVPTLQDDADKIPRMIVKAIVIAEKNVVKTDFKPPAFENLITPKIDLSINSADVLNFHL